MYGPYEHGIKPSSSTKFRKILYLLRGGPLLKGSAALILLSFTLLGCVLYVRVGELIYRRFSIYSYTRLNRSKDIYYLTLFNIKQIYKFLGP